MVNPRAEWYFRVGVADDASCVGVSAFRLLGYRQSGRWVRAEAQCAPPSVLAPCHPGRSQYDACLQVHETHEVSGAVLPCRRHVLTGSSGVVPEPFGRCLPTAGGAWLPVSSYVGHRQQHNNVRSTSAARGKVVVAVAWVRSPRLTSCRTQPACCACRSRISAIRFCWACPRAPLKLKTFHATPARSTITQPRKQAGAAAELHSGNGHRYRRRGLGRPG